MSDRERVAALIRKHAQGKHDQKDHGNWARSFLGKPTRASKTRQRWWLEPGDSKRILGREGRNFDDLTEIVRRAEAELGGAWSYSAVFGSIELVRATNPSQIPDWFKDRSSNRIFWKGEWRSFTPAAIRREEWKGLGGD